MEMEKKMIVREERTFGCAFIALSSQRSTLGYLVVFKRVQHNINRVRKFG